MRRQAEEVLTWGPNQAFKNRNPARIEEKETAVFGTQVQETQTG